MSKVLCLTIALVVFTIQGSAVQSQCPQGQLLFSGVCKSIFYLEGCASYNADNSCRNCEYGYQLSQGQCFTGSNNKGDCCASYGSDGSCLQCSPGLYSSDPYCSRNEIYGCILKKDNQCLVCGSGLSFYQGSCIVSVEGCNNYNQAGVCVACKSGHKIVNNYCYPFPEVAYCQSHNQYGCIQCQKGYYLTSQKQCKSYQPGCLSYWQEKCTTCLPLFTLIQGQCVIAGCQKYTSTACVECGSGLTLAEGRCQENGCLHVVNNTCVKCRESLRLTPQGCIEPINYHCKSCASGYQFYQGKCIKTIYGCMEYSSANQCAQCASPFTLAINGECQILGCKQYCSTGCSQCISPFALKNSACVIEYCNQYNSNGCTACQNGYMLVSGYCHPKDVNCEKYEVVSGQVKCTCCIDGYLLVDGECKQRQRGCWYNKSGKCTCKPPFALKDGQCQLVGCSSYNWQTCLSCYSPFQYDQQTKNCLIPNCLKYDWNGCLSCSDGWLAKNGVCIQGDPYCLSYNQQGQCQACQSGFILSQGKCAKNIPNCQQLSSDLLSCIKCANGYTIYQGNCRRLITNCKEINYLGDYCTCCNSGYHLSNGECSINDPNCQQYSKHANQPNEYCSQCKEAYFYDPSTNSCQPKAPGCIYTGCDCKSCIQPFNYDNQRQTCWISGCQKYSLTGCLTCSSPFKAANNVCVIDYCLSYGRDCCQKCQQGYAISQQGLCVKINPNCLAYEGTQCIKCRDGFSLLQGNCVVQDENCVTYGQNGIICTTCNKNYHPDAQGKCQPDAPGCTYQNGACISCCAPFTYNSQLKVCQIPNCQQANNQGCIKCRAPFTTSSNGLCVISNCLRSDSNSCLQCKPQYHLNNGGCVADSPNCRFYSASGACELCVDKYVLSSSGECVEGSLSCISYSQSDRTKCLECGTGYFLNRYFQCEKQDGRCEAYTNGVCSKCAPRYFLYSDICFPYTKGCVQYSGKDCTACRNKYVLKNGECFNWEPSGMTLLGGDDRYDFEINPIDVRQSKYYIDNLSPASELGKIFFSSSWDSTYQDCSLSTLEGASGKGWRAKVADQNQYIGVTLSGQPATFYALQLEAVDGSFISEFYIEYSTDGSTFIRVQTPFTVSSSVATNMTTIYFTGLYAKAIRIRITSYHQWPACRIEFFYYDLLRFRKISNLKSLTYLQQTINSNFVDRVDNQIFINQVYFFNPSAECSLKDLCFTGLQLCEPKIISGLTLNFESPSSYITEFYITYSVDGRSYNCYQNCKGFKIDKCTNNSFSMKLENLKAQGVRIYPKNYQGSAKFSPTFFYE